MSLGQISVSISENGDSFRVTTAEEDKTIIARSDDPNLCPLIKDMVACRTHQAALKVIGDTEILKQVILENPPGYKVVLNTKQEVILNMISVVTENREYIPPEMETDPASFFSGPDV